MAPSADVLEANQRPGGWEALGNTATESIPIISGSYDHMEVSIVIGATPIAGFLEHPKMKCGWELEVPPFRNLPLYHQGCSIYWRLGCTPYMSLSPYVEKKNCPSYGSENHAPDQISNMVKLHLCGCIRSSCLDTPLLYTYTYDCICPCFGYLDM